MRKPQPDAERTACGGRIRALRPPVPPVDHRLALSRLLPLWPHELEDASVPARRHIVARLRNALRAERRRGVAGHWTYDLARHVELLRLYRAELAALRLQLVSAEISGRNEDWKRG